MNHDVLKLVSSSDITEKILVPSKFILEIKRTGKIKARWVVCETLKFRPKSLEDYAATVSSTLLQLLLSLNWNI